MLGDLVTQELVNSLQQFRVARLDSNSAALPKITARSVVRINATLIDWTDGAGDVPPAVEIERRLG
jgi:hypothetical protein